MPIDRIKKRNWQIKLVGKLATFSIIFNIGLRELLILSMNAKVSFIDKLTRHFLQREEVWFNFFKFKERELFWVLIFIFCKVFVGNPLTCVNTTRCKRIFDMFSGSYLLQRNINVPSSSKFHEILWLLLKFMWDLCSDFAFQNSDWFSQCQHFFATRCYFLCRSSFGVMNISLTILVVFELRRFNLEKILLIFLIMHFQ